MKTCDTARRATAPWITFADEHSSTCRTGCEACIGMATVDSGGQWWRCGTGPAGSISWWAKLLFIAAPLLRG